MYFFATRKDNKTEMIYAYPAEDFPLQNVSRETFSVGKRQTVKDFATIDIETTTIQCDEPYGFMYHWQACISGIPVYGRDYGSLFRLLDALVEHLKCEKDTPYIIYIHNAGFEFQFFRQHLIAHFGEIEVFAPQRRKPLVVRTQNGLEFRCSYKLTNMSLYKFTSTQHGCVYLKSDGDLDYSKLRYADTPLTDLEFSYCMNDVWALYHALHAKMKDDGDVLCTIPLTSTGYVRRDCRKKCRSDPNYRKIFNQNYMSPNVYKLLVDAGRGGDTGANRYLAGALISDVDSFDVTSSYPYQMLTQEYPMSRFYKYDDTCPLEELSDLCKKKAVLFRIGFKNLKLKPDSIDAYLPSCKAQALSHPKIANGRVLFAEEAIYTFTEIDWKIVSNLYSWSAISIGEVWTAKKDILPQPIRDTVYQYFIEKCKLALERNKYPEDSEEYEYYNYLYMKSKNKLNGIFGMTYTNPVREENYIDEDGYWLKPDAPDIAQALKDFYESYNSFLVYAWGVWTTAHARNHLQWLISLTGNETAYWDTDSSKAHVNESIIKAIHTANEEIKVICRKYNAYYKDFYLGIFEHETASASYINFKTLGAKKYAYTDRKNRLHCTISGVAKSKSPIHPDGARELGSIDKFKPGFIFKEAGGKTLYYNQRPFSVEELNGHKIEIGDNIAMLDSSYTIGLTREYAEIIGANLSNLDNPV